jgi:DUF3040 family protein
VTVPLSDHEQRLLEQIERALYAEDPKFASAVRSTDLRTHYRRRLVRAAVGVIIGIGILVAGIVANPFPSSYLVFGVAGFLVMFGSALYGVTSWRRSQIIRGVTQPRAVGPKLSVVERFEERWRRRRDDRGF